jgi:hypothetical protein
MPPIQSSPISIIPSPTVIATPTPLTDDPRYLPSPEDPNWSRFISDQGGFYYLIPSSFTIKETADHFNSFHPVWYDTQYYFNCINGQLGISKPFPCWLFNLEISTGSSETISSLSPASGKIFALENSSQTHIDNLNRTWQIIGPIETPNSIIYLSETEIDRVIYQLHTETINISMREYLRKHQNRPFAKNISESEKTSLQQAHLDLLKAILSSFTTFRKPFINEPSWLRHRFSNNWSVAYPEPWNIYTPNQAALASDQEGLIQGWYGNGNFISFHKYSIILSTPNLGSHPPSVTQSLEQWVNFELAKLPVTDQNQIEILITSKRKGRRDQKTVEFETQTLLNLPNDISLFLDTGHFTHPIHRSHIWELDQLPPRTVTIRQLDGLYEPQSMQQLLETFIKRIYE